MKKLFCLIAIYLAIPFTFAFAQVSPLSNGFYLGSFGSPSVGNYHRPLFFDKYDSLSYNMFVGYIGHFNYEIWCNVFGGFYDIPSVYSGNQQTIVTDFQNHYGSSGGFYIFLEREKLLRPAYGQSSKYQAEMDNPQNEYINRPGYGYTVRNGTPFTESFNGEMVSGLSCQRKLDNAQYIVNSLYENLEQMNLPAASSGVSF